MNTLKTTEKILLIGIGNYGRADDALGWKFIDTFSTHTNLFDIEYRYQLQIEDAELISQYQYVIFADAHHRLLPSGFSYYICKARPAENFTTHALTPENVCWVAHELYNATPICYVMAISGHHWKLRNSMSQRATKNLTEAVRYFKKLFGKMVNHKIIHPSVIL